MTIFGWDTSNYDDPPTVRDGIDFLTHKAAEGHHFYYDREYRQSMENARSLGIPVLGAYFVNHPGSVADQVDWFIQILDQDTPWWRTHECFVLQIDAEHFSYMPSAPTLAEIQAFGDRLVNVHGIDPRRILAYAPRWLYGDTLAGLTYRLWASDYGGNPYLHYRDAYPGDADVKRWRSYSGQEPLILQYGSNTTIGNQTTCDANAFRGTLAELMTILGSVTPLPPHLDLGDEMVAMLVQDASGMAIMWIDGTNVWYRGIPDASSTTRKNLAKAGVTTFGDDDYPWDLSQLSPPRSIGDFASPWQLPSSGSGNGQPPFSGHFNFSGTIVPE